MKLSEYDYYLPKELIAQNPLGNRSDSRLFVLSKNSIEHKIFSDIIDYFNPGDVLVLNNTKVIKAKLVGKKETGGHIEAILFPKFPDFDISSKVCKCRIKGRVKKGSKLIFGKYLAEIIEKDNDFSVIEFDTPILDVIDAIGQMPLPPYIKEKLEKQDRYQTKYANIKGSIAAPTAGLHFTPKLLSKLKSKGVIIVEIVLHVSFGTFTPIHTDDVLDHKMDKEYFEISKSAADAINDRKGKLFVVGTTTLKALESAADTNGKIFPKRAWSDLFLTPAYRYRVAIHALITNFHLPKSTLILLVAGFIGKKTILDAYKVAVEKKYRFFSFGDSMLIIKD